VWSLSDNGYPFAPRHVPLLLKTLWLSFALYSPLDKQETSRLIHLFARGLCTSK
jgi:hypothetical protein